LPLSLASHPLRGPLFMVLATGSYVVNDTLMKLATEGLPPYEVLMLRGVAASLWGFPLLLILGYGAQLRQMFERRVLARNLSETAAILCYVVALANMPIADASALGQITPLLVLLGASLLFGERIGALRMGLIGLGFVGALMVAQPTMQGISIYALLALANAVLCAVRDIAGRRVPHSIPGMIVAMSAVVVVLAGAAAMHVSTETWVMPQGQHLLLLAGAGFFLIFGHFFIFMAYRVGPTGAVAPFYYFFTFWAVLSGLVVFGQLPNTLALGGIVLVVASGLTIVLLDERRRRLAPVG
jgi:drug/metabolite transporter (DMT)-like permease